MHLPLISTYPLLPAHTPKARHRCPTTAPERRLTDKETVQTYMRQWCKQAICSNQRGYQVISTLLIGVILLISKAHVLYTETAKESTTVNFSSMAPSRYTPAGSLVWRNLASPASPFCHGDFPPSWNGLIDGCHHSLQPFGIIHSTLLTTHYFSSSRLGE